MSDLEGVVEDRRVLRFVRAGLSLTPIGPAVVLPRATIRKMEMRGVQLIKLTRNESGTKDFPCSFEPAEPSDFTFRV
jgi:hypothetical protein